MLRVNHQAGFGARTYAKESRDLIDSFATRPNDGRTRLIDLTVRELLGADVWPKIDAMWVQAAHEDTASRINWKSPGSFALSPVGAPTFTVDRGRAGDGSSTYDDTTWDAVNNGVQMTSTSGHISIYQRTAGSNGIHPFANDQSGVWRLGIGAKGTGANSASGKINSSTELVGTPAALPFFLLARTPDGVNGSMICDNAQIVAPTALSLVTTVSSDLRFGKRQSTYTNAQVAAGTVGAYLDDTQAFALSSILHAYMVAIGADT